MFGIQCSQHVYDWLVLISFYNGPPAYPVSLVFFLRSSSQYPPPNAPIGIVCARSKLRLSVDGPGPLSAPFSASPLRVPYPISHPRTKRRPRWSAPYWFGCSRSIAMSRQRCVLRVCACTCATAARLSRRIAHCFANRFVVQEYDKCYNLVRECSPHARIAYDCTSIESFRESAVHDPIPRIHLSPPLPGSVRRSRWYMQARSYHKCCRSS